MMVVALLLLRVAGVLLLIAQCVAMAAATTTLLPVRNVTLLALGDSITWGCGSQAGPGERPGCGGLCGGYRIPLIGALSQAGYNITTMGRATSGPVWAPRVWTHHAGYPGWRIDQIDAVLKQEMATSPTPPELITIHLGTNDCGQGMHNITAVMVARMQSLLGHVYEAAPKARVFLASIIGMPQKPAWVNCSTDFNAVLPNMAKQWNAKGMNIVYTPMYEWSGVCVSQFAHRPATGKTPALKGLCCSGDVVRPQPPVSSCFAPLAIDPPSI